MGMPPPPGLPPGGGPSPLGLPGLGTPGASPQPLLPPGPLPDLPPIPSQNPPPGGPPTPPTVGVSGGAAPGAQAPQMHISNSVVNVGQQDVGTQGNPAAPVNTDGSGPMNMGPLGGPSGIAGEAPPPPTAGPEPTIPEAPPRPMGGGASPRPLRTGPLANLALPDLGSEDVTGLPDLAPPELSLDEPARPAAPSVGPSWDAAAGRYL